MGAAGERRIDADAAADAAAGSGRAEANEAVLLEVARGLAGAVEIGEVMDSVVRAAVELTRATGAYVEGVQAPAREVEVLAAAGEGAPAVGTRTSYPGSLTEEIIRAGEPEFLTEVGALGESMAPYLARSCRRCTGLVTPLISQGEAVGALVLLRAPEAGRFGPAEAVRARLLGDLASVALRRVLDHAALRSREARFRAVALNAADGIVTTDAGERIRFVNPAAEGIFGYAAEELRGRPFRTLVPEPAPAGGDGPARGPAGARLCGRHREGHEIPLEASVGEFEQDGERFRTHILRDVSERVRLQESKARLMRGFGHDLKNPLGAADGFAALLEDGLMGPLTEKQLRSVGRIRRSIGTALELIRDLVELSRAEAGELELAPEALELGALVCDAAEDQRAAAQAAGLELQVRAAPEPLACVADPARVRQILANLLSNAIKYTPAPGRVGVAAEREPGGAWLAVRVSDTGVGIPEERQPLLFHEFTRLAPGLGEGAGLGLAISRHIARRMGGDIDVESAQGRGSVFTLRLPG